MGFLKDNKERFLSEIDYTLLESDDKLSIFTDAFLELFDTLLERGPASFEQLIDIDEIPTELINHLSSLVGWRQKDYKFNTVTYREFIKNIVRIYKIKGTKLSYDVFFRALGYDARLDVLWWNRDSQLVPVKPVGAPDPSKPTNVLNRSNFAQIEFDLVVNDPDIPDPFSDTEFLNIVLDYLYFLKPLHIKYKPILLNIPPYFEIPVPSISFLPIVIVGDDQTDVNIGGKPGEFEDRPDGQLVDEFQIYQSYPFDDCAPLRYNNAISYGEDLAKVAQYGNFVFPVSIRQRDTVAYGDGCAPIEDELKITIITNLSPNGEPLEFEDQFELRYSNHIYFDSTTSFDLSNPAEIIDGIVRESQQISFGPGNVFSKPSS